MRKLNLINHRVHERIRPLMHKPDTLRFISAESMPQVHPENRRVYLLLIGVGMGWLIVAVFIGIVIFIYKRCKF